MKENLIETITGFIVICIAAMFFIFAYRVSGVSDKTRVYALNASFENVDGLSEGNDVKLSGIKIGYIDKVTLEQGSYYANTRLKIKKGVIIPADSRAIVSTSGLFGSKYIRINPGASEEVLKENEKIQFTQSAINIEDLIGKLVYSMTSGKSS